MSFYVYTKPLRTGIFISYEIEMGDEHSTHVRNMKEFDIHLCKMNHVKPKQICIIMDEENPTEFALNDATRNAGYSIGHLREIDYNNALGPNLCFELWPSVVEGFQWYNRHLVKED